MIKTGTAKNEGEKVKKYYPTYWLGCTPLHHVTSWCKVRKLIRDARRGDKIPPVVIDGDIGSGTMITGTHRAAANDIMMMLGGEPLIAVIGLDDMDVSDDLQSAIDDGDFERINDIIDGH